jgi:hypothetical protein
VWRKSHKSTTHKKERLSLLAAALDDDGASDPATTQMLTKSFTVKRIVQNFYAAVSISRLSMSLAQPSRVARIVN